MKSFPHTNDILVSTVIPSYNKHHYLKEALFSALQQTHENQEIIIINDYPTVEARDTINDLKNIDARVKVLHNSNNIGIAQSRNKAIQYATGELVAMLDHDDIWVDQQKLDKQIQVLQADKNMAVVGSQYYDIDKDGNVLKPVHFPLTDAAIRKKINMGMPSLHSSLVFQKKVLQQIGGFDANVSMTDDYEILFRALRVGKMQNLADYTTHYRLHENTSFQTGNPAIMRNNSFKVMLQQGYIYPNYVHAIMHRLFWVIPYGSIRPYLSNDLVAEAKKIKNILLGRSNQSYNHINSQDVTLE